MKCPKCGEEMIQLITSWVCPADCHQQDQSGADFVHEDQNNVSCESSFELERNDGSPLDVMNIGLWRCECGSFPDLHVTKIDNKEVYSFSTITCVSCDCKTKLATKGFSSIRKAKRHWNKLLQQEQGWEELGPIDSINMHGTHDLEEQFMLGEAESIMHKTNERLDVTIEVGDRMSNGTLVTCTFDTCDVKITDSDILAIMLGLTHDEHSGFEKMILYGKREKESDYFDQYRIEFVFGDKDAY